MLTRLYSPAHRRNREQGFTLIELLIVVIIIGILAAIALPVFLNQQKAANDASAVSDVRNTVDSVQTFLVAKSGTAYTNTGAYMTAGGKATISQGNTVGVSIGTDASYQVCGYRTNADGNQYKTAGAAYTYTTSGTAAGTFAKGTCTSGSDTGGSTGAQAQGGGTGGGVSNGIYTATAEAGDSTNSMWYTGSGGGVLTNAQAHSGSMSYASSLTARGAFTPSPALPNGQKYRVSGYIMSTVADSMVVAFQPSITGATTTVSTTPGTWTPFTFTGTIPNTTAYWVSFNDTNFESGGKSGTFYVDDLTITPIQ